MRYLDSPDQIEVKAQEYLAQLPLQGFLPTQREIARRMIQACADIGIAEHIRITANVSTTNTLRSITSRHVLCDAHMVKAGINQRWFQGDTHCFINDPRVIKQAAERNKTRSLVAVDFWQPLLTDSCVIIGNAPTALFRLLEVMQQPRSRPALIIGIPVGFVGAAEAKRLLWQYCAETHIPCITVFGPRGGSAIAVSAFNALLRMARQKDNL